MEKFGCHCDLNPGEEPDDCVVNTGEHDDCVYARKGMKPEACPYWKPISAFVKEPVSGEPKDKNADLD